MSLIPSGRLRGGHSRLTSLSDSRTRDWEGRGAVPVYQPHLSDGGVVPLLRPLRRIEAR